MNIKITLDKFLSKRDELIFFDALNDIPAVKDYAAKGQNLLLNVDRRILNSTMLRDLISLLTRYGIDLFPLSVFADNHKFAWLSDTEGYWYENMFDARA